MLTKCFCPYLRIVHIEKAKDGPRQHSNEFKIPVIQLQGKDMYGIHRVDVTEDVG